MPVTVAFRVGELYSSDQIQRSLGVGNAGGVRLSIGDDGQVQRMVVMTSVPTARQRRENPYHDRIEGNTLVYTGAGREGDQTLAGMNQRIPQQYAKLFPIYGFVLIGSRRDKSIGPKRWRFLGLLRYLRHYPETQVDIRLQRRQVWLFEFCIHIDPSEVSPVHDRTIAAEIIAVARAGEPQDATEREIADPVGVSSTINDAEMIAIESIRGQLLGVAPQRFEHLVREALEHSGFERVTVTQYSQDGGIDVNAFAGIGMWPIRDLLVQVQAKRWLHTVGRKEIAELRGSLQPYARGAVITTSHFSRAAITEASGQGKNPIVLVDGFTFASMLHTYSLSL